MKIKGMNYDIGIEFVYGDPNSKINVFNKQYFKRDLEIIRDELHCNAIRLSGTDVQDMLDGTEMVLQAGLDCWTSPHYIDAPLQDVEDKTQELAVGLEKLRTKYPDNEVVIIYGCEMHHFAPFLPGNNYSERLASFAQPDSQKTLAEASAKLNAYFARVIPKMREVFGGRITYTTVTFETLDWTPFDIICLDQYKSMYNRDTFKQEVAPFIELAKAQNKTFVIPETGYCCFKGCSDYGAAGFMILYPVGDGKVNQEMERAEKEREEAFTDVLTEIAELDVEGVFPFTFVYSQMPHVENDPIHDLDMAGFGITKTYTGGKRGSVFEGVNWDPKEAFYAIKDFFETH